MSLMMHILPGTAIVALSGPVFELAGPWAGTLGYVGPGAGLSMLGALFAVVCVVLLALLAPILYPIRWLRGVLRRRREQSAARQGADSADVPVAVELDVADSYPGPPSTREPVLAGTGGQPQPLRPANESNQFARSEHE